MPRPLRIEYNNAYYHVMNRGRSRQKIFHGADYYQVFLDTLSQAHQRFGIEILCYCLMSNHYHLLLKTPEGNLGRAMRHINGVYTQRYNRLRKTDGSLFRGRYKAILVEEDSYQLQVSRYIHLNPIDAKMIQHLDDYPWSSYPAYIGQSKIPPWLYTGEILARFQPNSQPHKGYHEFVMQGVDEELKRFYGKGNMVPYLGSDSFRDWAYQHRQTDSKALTKTTQRFFRPAIDEIIADISQEFNVSQQSIMTGSRGRTGKNIPRWVAMYLAQEVCGAKLNAIAAAFNLNSIASISNNIANLKSELGIDKQLLKRVDLLISKYDT